MPNVQFPQFLTDTDFSATTGSLVLTTAKWNEVCRKTTGAQQILNWGVGIVAGGVDTRETATIRLDSSAGNIAGKIRLVVTDANGIQVIPIYENNNTNFASGVKLALANPGARQDSALVIQSKPDSTTTLDFTDADTAFNIPVTVTNLA
jgi:hypothetical protein